MLIPPLYKITPEIVEILSKIDANRIILSSQKIPPKLKNKIQRISLLNSSLFSARIEGNPLTIENLGQARDRIRKTEVFNIIAASDFIAGKIKKGDKIIKEILLKLHELVMKNISTGGTFRRDPSAIFNSAGQVVYLPPVSSEINNLLTQILNFTNSREEKFPLISALICHLVFEKIHPFIDGNGRVGRLLIFAVLKARGYDFGMTIPFEKYLDEHKSRYYDCLDNGLKRSEDYLVFMLESVYEESKNLLREIEAEKNKAEDLYLLPPRQEEIVRIVREHVFTSFDFLRRRFKEVPERTLRYDLKKLQEKGFLVKTGITKGSYYKVVK